MNKTVQQWIDNAIALTQSEKEKAKEYATNCCQSFGVDANILDVERDSFHDALAGSFVFAETKEGHDYWWNVMLLEEKAMDSLYDYSAE